MKKVEKFQKTFGLKIEFSRSIILLCALLLGIQVLHAQTMLAKKIGLDTSIKSGKLPNGLTYYIQKNDHPQKKAEFRLIVNAGSIQEDNDQQGLAHMMEHMNFNGLKHFPKNELVSYLQSIGVQFGADLNAYTGFNETVYILPLPTDDPVTVGNGFTILEDWAFNALLDPLEIDKERGVVLEEWRLGKNAGERMAKQYNPVLFNGSHYAQRLPIGKDSIIRNFDPPALVRFYKTWYRPDLMTILIVGDIDPVLAEIQIKKHFAAYANPSPEKPRVGITTIPVRQKSESLVLTDKEQPYSILQIFNYIKRTKSVSTWGDYRRTIVEELFNTMISQRLNDRTKVSAPPFVSANAAFSGFIRGYSSFTSAALLNNESPRKAIETLFSVTESIKKYGFLQAELQRAKADILTQAETAFDETGKTGSADLVNDYISKVLRELPIISAGQRYAFLKNALPTISLQEVNAVTDKTENTQGFFGLLIGTEALKKQLPGSHELTEWIVQAKKQLVNAYHEKKPAAKLLNAMPVAGKIVKQWSNNKLGTTEMILSNGISITLKPTNFKNDEIYMDGWRQGGSRNFSLSDRMNAGKAAIVIQEMGFNDLTPNDIRKFISGKKLNVASYINANEEGIEGDCSVKALEMFFQLVYLNFTAPRKDPILFSSYINSQKNFVSNVKAIPSLYFYDSLNKLQYSNNPWAVLMDGAESYDQIQLDRSFEIYKGIFGNAYGMHFTFVGNIEIEKIKPLLETYIASLPAKPKENTFTDVGLRPAPGVINMMIKKGSAKQSRVKLIFHGLTAYNKDEELKLVVLKEVMNIKIMEQLREKMSGIYGGGMNASLNRRPYENYNINIEFPCGPENENKLIDALFSILKTVKENGIEQFDLDKVKEILKKQYQDKMQRNDYWLTNLSDAFIEEYAPDWFLNYPDKLNALTAKDVQDAANRYFNMNNYIVAILNPDR